MRKLYKSLAGTTVFLGISLFFSATSALAELPKHPLIESAQQKEARRVQYALDNGAQVGLTTDGKSYYVLWLPEGADPENPPPIVATMHGHDGCAFVDFFVWHKFLKKRGYGLLAVQWWLGKGEGIHDYLLPNEIYRAIDDVFQELKVEPGKAMLHGFSRGSANIYPVAAIDNNRGKKYFSLFVANAGKPNSDYPPVAEIEKGLYGDKPLQGTRWVTYGGGKDPNLSRDGSIGMRDAGEWIERNGGQVDLAIEDPEGDHGGFHRRPQNCEQALDVFERSRVRE